MRRKRVGIAFAVGMLWMTAGVSAQEARQQDIAKELGIPDAHQLTNYDAVKSSRHWAFVPFKDIPKFVVDAFVAAEDPEFFKRPSSAAKIPDEILQLIVKCRRDISATDAPDEEKSKASEQCISSLALGALLAKALDDRGQRNISLQLQISKQLMLEDDRTMLRKLKELIAAGQIDEIFTKEQVLEIYLNRIFLGMSSYGIGAAARTYFNKPVGKLTIEEAAYLAALPRGPSNYHPINRADKAIERRNLVLTRMAEDGYITAHVAEAAKTRPLSFNPPPEIANSTRK